MNTAKEDGDEVESLHVPERERRKVTGTGEGGAGGRARAGTASRLSSDR